MKLRHYIFLLSIPMLVLASIASLLWDSMGAALFFIVVAVALCGVAAIMTPDA